MKRVLLYAALLSGIIIGCSKKEKKVTQAGVYELEKQMVVAKDKGGKDSTYVRSQIKIYTDKYFMYAGMAADSSVGFGIGTYTLAGNKVVETNVYSSGILDSARTFNLVITKSDSGYTQVIPDFAVIRGVKYDLKEDYRALPIEPDTSVLDGLWKMDRTYMVNGKDTTTQIQTQYKIFYGGHFTFIHRYPLDKAGTRYKNGFGTGVFSFRNDTLREEDEMSSHAVLLNQKFAIKISMNGNDEYTQVIKNAKTGEQSIETYRRVR
jgi:hypothetical protein